MELRKKSHPPYWIISNFLAEYLVGELLDYATTYKEELQPATIHAGYDPRVRVSQKLYLNKRLRQKLEEKIRPLTADFIEALGVGTFEPEGVELELIAHGDGAFYSRHIDTFTGEASNANAGRQRLISAVFYAYRQPKGFSGGALRLYSLHRDDTLDDFIDITPMHNCLVVFPSWVPHSVELVSCPSGNFADSRFAVNAWLWRNKPAVSRLAKPI